MENPKTTFAVSDEKGSAIVIALLVLLLLTLGGISAINMSITESYIVRNSGIHKQNLQLAEMAALEGLRGILTRNDATELISGEASAPLWIRDMAFWDNDPTKNDPDDHDCFPLNDNNSADASADTLDIRGETGNTPLRYYFIGWRDAPQSSLVMTAAMWRQGRVIGIYNSQRYGLASVELGVIKRF